jgi:Raf kinase inhibitor-like YbhB/YbcL family protein
MHRGLAFSIAALLIVSAACSSTSSTTSDKTVGVALPMTLTSTAFVDGGAIPMDFSCDGRNMSPPLSWSAPPSATLALVIVVDDQDVTFTHWALYDLLSGTSLPAGVPATAALASGGKQGLNSAGTVGYTGPCPPRGSTHHYVFRIIALDTPTGLPPGAKASEVESAMQGHIIGTGELAGTFGH